jgi:general secretion pathway protein G
MGRPIRNGSCPPRGGKGLRNASPTARRGFSFVELLVVVSVVVILISMAIPIYNRTILRSKETVLKSNLFTMRTQISHFTMDRQRAPQSLDELVRDGYLQKVPVDPMTGSNQGWRTIPEDPNQAVNQSEPGIVNVKSTSDRMSSEGTAYAEW